MRRLIVGDIHGALKALIQVLKRCNFNPRIDELVVLGDVCDGWTETKQCIDYLLTIPNLIYIIGNHDQWTLEWMTEPRAIEWATQGGDNTFNSYVPKTHIEFFKESFLWHHDTEANQLFVHGGINPSKPMENQTVNTCLWDRELIRVARKKHNQNPEYQYGGFNDIFIGHTTTQYINGCTRPLHYCNITNLDTGGGWSGKLTVMDAKTKEFWQSDYVSTLYPNEKGRG